MTTDLIMHRLCTQCKKIYRINYYNRFMGALILYTMFFTLDFKDDSYSLTTNIIIILISALVLLGPVWFLTKDLFKKEINCTECNGKNTLIKLNTPEAIEIIKENNLSFPDESPEEDKFPWETKS